MARTLGMDCILKVNNVQVDIIGDLTLNLDSNEVEVPMRGVEWDTFVPTTHKASIEFDMVWDPAVNEFGVLKDAWMDRTAVAIIVADDQGTEWAGDCCVFAFNVKQPRKEIVVVSVTLKPTYSANPISFD